MKNLSVFIMLNNFEGINMSDPVNSLSEVLARVRFWGVGEPWAFEGNFETPKIVSEGMQSIIIGLSALLGHRYTVAAKTDIPAMTCVGPKRTLDVAHS
jgi:hypothetical protein